jgi:hypothetical protein
MPLPEYPTWWQVAFEAVTKSMKERTGQLEARGAGKR